MTPTMISVRNLSDTLTDGELAAVVTALGIQLARDVAPIWGRMPALEFVPKGKEPSAGSCPAEISDTPDVADALGYHDEGPDGVPYIKVFVIDGYDWRVTLSHEILELAMDAAANLWADGPHGKDYARELSDAVQGDTYEIVGTPVSNFVYPAFFDPRAQLSEKLDHVGSLTRPFETGQGGYQIVRTEPGTVSEVFGHLRHVAPGLHVEFGPKFPEHLRQHKVDVAARRRARRAKVAA